MCRAQYGEAVAKPKKPLTPASYNAMRQQMLKIEDSVAFLQNAAEKALLWNPETDDEIAVAQFDKDDAQIVEAAKKANDAAVAKKKAAATVTSGEERIKGDSIETAAGGFNDDDVVSVTNEENMMVIGSLAPANWVMGCCRKIWRTELRKEPTRQPKSLKRCARKCSLHPLLQISNKGHSQATLSKHGLRVLSRS